MNRLDRGAARSLMERCDARLRRAVAVKLPLPNVWLGTSVEDQHRADERIPHLLKCPAAVRFLSAEPLLGQIILHLPTRTFSSTYGPRCEHCCNGDRCDDASHYDRPHCPYCRGTGNGKPIHWVIAGGESGPHARPLNVEWIRSIVVQCKAAGVACFVKQMGARVQLRNDTAPEWGREGDVLSWETEHPSYQGDIEIARLEDKKGGDMAEWPADLRVREMPAAEVAGAR
jgi:hypothetical protein